MHTVDARGRGAGGEGGGGGGLERGAQPAQASSVDTGRYNRLLPITSNMSSRADDEESSIILQNKMARVWRAPIHAHYHPLHVAPTPIHVAVPRREISRVAPVRTNMMYVLLALSSENYVFFISRAARTRMQNKAWRKSPPLYTTTRHVGEGEKIHSEDSTKSNGGAGEF